jgi:hypothetical protein
MSKTIDEQILKPILRIDPGSLNMAGDVRVFLREIGIGFSPGRLARPTDDARQERFNRTLKQEEIYCNVDYFSVESARNAIARYIDYCDEIRPHQALFGYTPAQIDRVGNKLILLEEYRLKVQQARKNRLKGNLQETNHQPTPFSS